jgi:hypothetical protein
MYKPRAERIRSLFMFVPPFRGMSNILAILFAFIFGVAGGFAASDLFKWVNLRLRSFIVGGIGGVVGLLAVQFAFPAVSGFDDWQAILGQMVAAFVCGALLGVAARHWRWD